MREEVRLNRLPPLPIPILTSLPPSTPLPSPPLPLFSPSHSSLPLPLTLLDPPLRDELGVPGRSTLSLDGCPPDEAAGLGGSDSSSSSTFSSTDSASLSSAGSSLDRLRPLSPCPGGDISWGWGCCGRGGDGRGTVIPPHPQLSGGCAAHLTVVPCCFVGLG